MRKHWRYLWYVLRHKWFVFLGCLQFRDPILIWRGIIHDWQKFTPAEWRPYVLSFYGPWKYKDRPEWLVADFDRAWLHHQHYGPHHWQHWVLREDSGATKALKMPRRYVQEMVADWYGAGRAINGRADLVGWYDKNREKIVLHPSTRDDVDRLIFGWTVADEAKRREAKRKEVIT